MKGIIIAGGLGTRLRPITYLRPKPLTPLANRPFLEYQVALLKKHGITDIVFATNYMADKIEAHFGDGSRFGVTMRYAIEETPLGTGGAIRNAADLFPGEAVAVFNGDILTDFDLGAVIAFHREKRAISTITLAAIPGPSPFGVLLLDKDGRAADWREPSEETKKALAAAKNLPPTGTDMINAGFYLLEPECVARIPQGERSSVERDIYPKLLAEQAAVFGFAPGGFWMDVGRAEQLMTATQAALSGEVRAAVPAISVGEGARISESATVSPHTAIGRGCVVGDGTQIDRCILMDNVTVGRNVVLRGIIIDDGATIEDDVTIEAHGGSVPVIAAHSVLAKGTRLN